MAVSVVQFIDAATSANSPTSITPTLASGSTAGNLLVMHVCVSGTSPTITAPAGWTIINNVPQANVACALFSLPNNAGAITSVAVTISATNGGAVASITEFAGLGSSAYQNFGNATIQSGTGTAPPPDAGQMLGQQGQMLYTAIGFQAATFTPGLATSEWNFGNPNISAVSTTATTNAQHQALWAITSYSQPKLNNTFGSSVSWIGLSCHFNNVGSFTMAGAQIGGSAGTQYPPQYQGMVGG